MYYDDNWLLFTKKIICEKKKKDGVTLIAYDPSNTIFPLRLCGRVQL